VQVSGCLLGTAAGIGTWISLTGFMTPTN